MAVGEPATIAVGDAAMTAVGDSAAMAVGEASDGAVVAAGAVGVMVVAASGPHAARSSKPATRAEIGARPVRFDIWTSCSVLFRMLSVQGQTRATLYHYDIRATRTEASHLLTTA